MVAAVLAAGSEKEAAHRLLRHSADTVAAIDGLERSLAGEGAPSTRPAMGKVASS